MKVLLRGANLNDVTCSLHWDVSFSSFLLITFSTITVPTKADGLVLKIFLIMDYFVGMYGSQIFCTTFCIKSGIIVASKKYVDLRCKLLFWLLILILKI